MVCNDWSEIFPSEPYAYFLNRAFVQESGLFSSQYSIYIVQCGYDHVLTAGLPLFEPQLFHFLCDPGIMSRHCSHFLI